MLGLRLVHDPARQWERFGRMDPYYGVYAVEEMHRSNLDEDARERFFASGGRARGTRCWESVRRYTGRTFAPRTILDHGCGVGRLVVPFAERAQRVVGVDVSDSMLAEARRNCDARGVGNVELLSADRLDTLAPEFDLVHSHIVLQHIPPKHGEPIFETLASLVAPGGVGAVQVPIAARRWLAQVHTWATRTLPLGLQRRQRRSREAMGLPAHADERLPPELPGPAARPPRVRSGAPRAPGTRAVPARLCRRDARVRAFARSGERSLVGLEGAVGGGLPAEASRPCLRRRVIARPFNATVTARAAPATSPGGK